MFSRISEGEESEYPFFKGDGSSSDEWRDYSMGSEDYEGPSVFDDDQYEEESMPILLRYHFRQQASSNMSPEQRMALIQTQQALLNQFGYNGMSNTTVNNSNIIRHPTANFVTPTANFGPAQSLVGFTNPPGYSQHMFGSASSIGNPLAQPAQQLTCHQMGSNQHTGPIQFNTQPAQQGVSVSGQTSRAVGQPSVTPAGQKTILPNAFDAMTLQNPAPGNCDMDTDNYSSPTADTASRTITAWRKVHEITVLKAILEYYNVIGKYPFDNESHMQKFYKDWIEW
nr:cyclic nucleotide-binding domain-containing protein [Tanacetum cinerariifolium]